MIAGPINTVSNLVSVSPAPAGTSVFSGRPVTSFSATLRETSGNVAAAHAPFRGTAGFSDIMNQAPSRSKPDAVPSRTHTLVPSSNQETAPPPSSSPATPLYAAMLLSNLNLSPAPISGNGSSPTGNPSSAGSNGALAVPGAGRTLSPAADGTTPPEIAFPQLAQSSATGSAATAGVENSAVQAEHSEPLPGGTGAGLGSTASSPHPLSTSGASPSLASEVASALPSKLQSGKDLVPVAKNSNQASGAVSHPFSQLPQASKPLDPSLPVSASAKSEPHQAARHDASPSGSSQPTSTAQPTGNAASRASASPLQSGLSKEPGKQGFADASGSTAESDQSERLSTGKVQSSSEISKGNSGNSEKGSSSTNDQDSSASGSATATATAAAGQNGGDTQSVFAKASVNPLPSALPTPAAGVPLSPALSPDAAGAAAPPKADATSAFAHPSATVDRGEPQTDTMPAYPGNLLNSAKMVERLGQAELRVGLQAGEFGRVDIRTSMLHNQFTAHISVERGELSKILASELPSLQSRLSEQRFPAGSITVEQQSKGGSAGFEQGSRQNQTNSGNKTSHSSERESVATSTNLAEATVATGRLDVHI